MEPSEVRDMLVRLFSEAGPGEYAEAVEEEVKPEYFEEMTPEDYKGAMDELLDTYDVPQEMRDKYAEQLDVEADYSADGYIKNLELIINDSDITQHIDNSLNVGDYAEVHGGIDQANETNLSNATGEGAIAGRDQDGQFQTGDGVQVGDHNAGVVNQGDNSGQIAGWDATADDVTTGDGNFNNEGTIEDSAVAFGGGSANNTANDVEDYSVNDSYNTDESFNTTDSFDTEDSFNTDHTTTETVDVDAHIDADVTDSFKEDNDDVHDHSESYTEVIDEH